MSAARCWQLMRFAKKERVARSALALALLLPVACPGPRRTESDGTEQRVTRDAPNPTCDERIARLEAEPRLPGTPELDQRRVNVLFSAKAEPVVFVRRPAKTEPMSEQARVALARLESSRHPWDVLARLVPVFLSNRSLAREVVLREGHLYTENPDLARALVEQVGLHHLFREPVVWVQRGESTRTARRTKSGRYVWADGDGAGEPARLLLHDRVGTGTPDAPLFRDLRALAHRLHFAQANVRAMTATRMVLDLRYGARWVPTLVRAHGARLELECESVAAPAELAAEREVGARLHQAVQVLRRVMLEQIDEGTLFDEPVTEVGQMDGRLRPWWRWAYLRGKDSFVHDRDIYPVFDADGRPVPPQVCTDFLLDTFQRASGTWWRRRGEERRVKLGRLDLEADRPFALRPAAHFIEFTERRRDWFEVERTPATEQFSVGRLDRLERHFRRRPDGYRAGDIVIIRGWTPWDEHEMHYHSFFVYETDPVSGVPILLAGNAGRPSLRTWRVETTRSPERVLMARIRPRLEWLETLLPEDAPTAPLPPPLGAESSAPPVVIRHVE